MSERASERAKREMAGRGGELHSVKGEHHKMGGNRCAGSAVLRKFLQARSANRVTARQKSRKVVLGLMLEQVQTHWTFEQRVCAKCVQLILALRRAFVVLDMWSIQPYRRSTCSVRPDRKHNRLGKSVTNDSQNKKKLKIVE